MSGTMLPNVECAVVAEDKILRYLLDLDHVQGASKARFFLARGASRDEWQVFAATLVEHARRNPVVKMRSRPDGAESLLQVDCHVPMPDGSTPCIRTVWELREGQVSPRLVTAHPLA